MIIVGFIVVVLLILVAGGKNKSKDTSPDYTVSFDFSEPVEDVKWVWGILWWVIKVGVIGIMIAGLATGTYIDNLR